MLVASFPCIAQQQLTPSISARKSCKPRHDQGTALDASPFRTFGSTLSCQSVSNNMYHVGPSADCEQQLTPQYFSTSRVSTHASRYTLMVVVSSFDSFLVKVATNVSCWSRLPDCEQPVDTQYFTDNLFQKDSQKKNFPHFSSSSVEAGPRNRGPKCCPV